MTARRAILFPHGKSARAREFSVGAAVSPIKALRIYNQRALLNSGNSQRPAAPSMKERLFEPPRIAITWR
jgi:hypothetical protein